MNTCFFVLFTVLFACSVYFYNVPSLLLNFTVLYVMAYCKLNCKYCSDCDMNYDSFRHEHCCFCKKNYSKFIPECGFCFERYFHYCEHNDFHSE